MNLESPSFWQSEIPDTHAKKNDPATQPDTQITLPDYEKNIEDVSWTELQERVGSVEFDPVENKIKIQGSGFILDKIIGSGGFGSVFSCKNEDPNDRTNPQELIIKQVLISTPMLEKLSKKEILAIDWLNKLGITNITQLKAIGFPDVLLKNHLPSLGNIDFNQGWSTRSGQTGNQTEMKTPAITPQVETIKDATPAQERTMIIVMENAGKNIYELTSDLSLEDETKKKEMTEKIFREIMAVYADALHNIHKKGFVHRDLKEVNLAFLNPGQQPNADPDKFLSTIIDFGLAEKYFPKKQNENYQEYIYRIMNSQAAKDQNIAGTPGYIDMLKYIKDPADWYLNNEGLINRPENDVFAMALIELNTFCQINNIPNLVVFKSLENPEYEKDYYEFIFHYLKSIKKQDGTQMLPEEFFRAFYVGEDPHSANKYRGEQAEDIRPNMKELHNAMTESLLSLNKDEMEILKQAMTDFFNGATIEKNYKIYKHITLSALLPANERQLYDAQIKQEMEKVNEQGLPFEFYPLFYKTEEEIDKILSQRFKPSREKGSEEEKLLKAEKKRQRVKEVVIKMKLQHQEKYL